MTQSHSSSVVCLVLLLATTAAAAESQHHPRESYHNVAKIDVLAAKLRRELRQLPRYSFSRGWWKWDRLRCRYVDGGRRDRNSLVILQAVFRGLVLDWHAKLVQRGEGDLFYLFYTTRSGTKVARKASDGRTLVRDLHGGGYHGGWGGAARMRIYDELVRQGMLSDEEQRRVQQLVHQSLSDDVIDFRKGAQTANNHSFGNAGGVALALKLFPKSPQAKEARAWLDRIWRDLAPVRRLDRVDILSVRPDLPPRFAGCGGSHRQDRARTNADRVHW